MSAQPDQPTNPPAAADRPAQGRRDNPPAGALADDELDAIIAWGAGDGDDAPAVEFPDEAPPAGGALVVAVASNGAIEKSHGDTAFAAAYDPEAEEREYSRALMSPGDLALVKADIDRHGFLTIEQVRELVKQNTVKETQEARGETYAIDPEMMMQIDTRTNFRIFITGDNVYTREELFDHFPFEAFRTAPEDVFVQQEVGVFPPKKWADPDKTAGEDAYEYVARDLGDDEEFIMIEDLVGRAARKNYKIKRAPVRIVKTKVFLGKDKWEDFMTMKRFVKSFKTFVPPLMLEGGDSSARALAYLFGGQPARRGAPLAIQDEAGLAAAQQRRDRAAQAREQAALRALEAKAKALQEKEDELRRREEDLFRSLGLDPPARPARGFAAEASAAAPGDAEGPDDSVAL